MSLADEDPQAGWPVVGPPTRVARWWLGGGLVVLLTATAVLGAVDVLRPDRRPLWQLLVAAVGLILVLGCVVLGGWMLWRGTPMRVVRRGAPQEPVRSADRRRIRRALLSGGQLQEGDDRRAATLLAGAMTVRPTLVVVVSMAGNSLLTLSTTAPEDLPAMIPFVAVVVATTLALSGAAWWALRIRRPAEAIGAVPVRVSG